MKPLDFTVRLDVTHVILHGQDLIHVLDLDQGHQILHEVICSTVSAVETVECGAVNTLLPGTGDADHVLFVFLTQGIHDSPVDLITQLNICVVLVVPLHTGLHQKILKNQIIEAAIVGFGIAEELPEGSEDLVFQDLLMQPKMQRHHKNYANIELCNKIDREIMDTLNEQDQEYMVSVACAWQQRVYSAAMDGFYCGYRAAYNMMESINPLVQIQHVDKILTMEYHLGYIKPYSEVERLRDMAA